MQLLPDIEGKYWPSPTASAQRWAGPVVYLGGNFLHTWIDGTSQQILPVARDWTFLHSLSRPQASGAIVGLIDCDKGGQCQRDEAQQGYYDSRL